MHCRSNQKGEKGMSLADAKRLAGEAPDYHSTDMWEAIERGEFPTWTFSVQVMTAEQAEQYRWNIFDDTKTWAHADFPLRPLGKLTLNRNVSRVEAGAHRSRAITLPKSSRQPSRRPPWCPESPHRRIPVSHAGYF
jgi:catalase